MRICKVIAVLVLAAAPCLAVDVSACGTSLAARNSTYKLTADLVQTGATPCLQVTAGSNSTTPANIIIDCDGHEIVFNGVAINMGDRDGIEIMNCTLTSAATGYTSSEFTWNGIDGRDDSASNILIHDNTFTLDHDSAPEPYGVIVSNKASDNFQFYDNTCYLRGAHRSTCIEVTGAGDKTNWKIHDNTILVTGTTTNRTTGIGLIGTTGVEVYNNTIQVNDPAHVGDADQVQSISCYKCITPNLHHNTITEYGTHGRVFSNDGVQGGSIHHNTVYLFGDGSGGQLQGIGMRGTTDGLEVYQNVIDARGCTGGALGGCAPFWIGSDTNTDDDTYPSGNRIHDNWIYTDGNNQHTAFSYSENWEADNRFWNMTVSCEGSSYCIEAAPHSSGPGSISDGEWAYGEFIDNSTALTFITAKMQNSHDLNFCETTVNGSPMSISDVSNTDASLQPGEPGFTSRPCLCETAGLGCGPTVGARADGTNGANLTVDASATVAGSITIR